MQFVLSIVLLTGTVVVYNQLKFIQHRNPGFTKANLLYMPMTGEIWSRQAALRVELSRNPLTSNYTIVDELPVNLISGNVDGKWRGKDPNTQIVIPGMNVSDAGGSDTSDDQGNGGDQPEVEPFFSFHV